MQSPECAHDVYTGAVRALIRSQSTTTATDGDDSREDNGAREPMRSDRLWRPASDAQRDGKSNSYVCVGCMSIGSNW